MSDESYGLSLLRVGLCSTTSPPPRGRPLRWLLTPLEAMITLLELNFKFYIGFNVKIPMVVDQTGAF